MNVLTNVSPSLNAPLLDASVAYSAGGHTKLLEKSVSSGHIKGTLILSGFTSDPPSPSPITIGSKVGIVPTGTLNGEDIDGIHGNCAWLSAPPSLFATMSSDSTILFSNNAKFNKVDIPSTSATVSQINGHAIDKYNLVARDKKYNVGGKKTFASGCTAKDITAKTFNSFTLDQFITKNSAQSISGTSTFNTFVSADKISSVNPNSPPTVDGVDLKNLLSYDLESVQSQNGVVVDNVIARKTEFSTIKINPGLIFHENQTN